MFDMPPPSTTTSGSSTLISDASARPSRSWYRASVAAAPGSPRAAAAAISRPDRVRPVCSAWSPELLLAVASERPAVEPGGVGVLHEPCSGGHRSRDADAHGARCVGSALELPHQRRDRVERGHVVTRRRQAASRDLFTGG